MPELDTEDLLKKNPSAREIFEQNQELLSQTGSVQPRSKGYGLGIPYGGRGVTKRDLPADDGEKPTLSRR